MKEIWKDIKNYENAYQVSNYGNVRSLDRYVTDKNKIQFIKGKTLKPTNNGNGYLIVSLLSNGKRKNHYVHRLVAQTFFNNYENNLVVNHKDFNKKNNNINNLEIVTTLENIQYSINKNRYKKSIIINSLNREKKAKQKVLENKNKIYELYRKGIGIDNISKQLHLKYDNVANIIKKKFKWCIYCEETKETFEFIKDANKKYSVTTISAVINKKQKTAANYHWKKILKEY